ncbi:ROK family protein [Amphibacillus sp. Q70]|uniref:ROK family protein n=1 Tax=Amphibacillus sp. Q70 TaxID=3453416 RepID=UPI003F825958
MDIIEKYLVFDFGGTKIKHGLINANGEIITKATSETEAEDLDKFLDVLFTTIHTYQINNRVHGIAISMPGYIDNDTGYSERAGAIVALDGKNIKQILAEKFSLPIEVENDGNCAALAEKMSGNAQDVDHFICMTIGTGIGGCLYLNGDIYRGSRLRAGEFGMMITHLADGEKKDMHQTAAFSNLIAEYKSYKNMNDHIEGTQVFEEVKTDPKVKQIVDRWIEHITRGIYNLTVTLNPEKILISGGVSAQPYLIEEINRQLKDYQYWHEFTIPVIRCKYLNDAGMIGAFYHFKTMQEERNK